MGDFDEYPEILEALEKLEFLCGTFYGTRRSRLPWGEASRADAVEWQAAWVLDGFYLQEVSSHGFHFWGYDYLAKQYRRWSFARYGHFGRGCPDPYAWIGSFEGDRLVMTAEYESITPVAATMFGWKMPAPDFPMKFAYIPGTAAGRFSSR